MTKMRFSDRLDSIALLAGFKLPQFNLFDGNGDPLKHLKGFITHMAITSNNPDVYAKAFPNSLTGKALDWYMELPLKSLDSYQATTDAFVAKFGTTIQSMQDERILMGINQNLNEPLSGYYKRYNDLLLGITAAKTTGARYNPPRERERSVRPGDKHVSPPRATGRIDTISGGISGGGDFYNSRKNYSMRAVYSTGGAITQNEPISFSDSELKGTELPHDDPVVIAPLISR
ncbi:hypothetical protein LIER_07057 [Lithospermum erythrorhizon]|uniref:Retrotransposon gag domain-containing protein n=1 Tax=Lithospermum erythrorhizon TaxID=34254 RepID=A0AAV3P6W9_LITER